jgi:HlyD family secretion protein
MAASPARSNTARNWIVSAVALIVIFYGVHMLTRGKLPIRVAAATVGNLTKTSATNGKVEPQLKYEAHAPFPGVITGLYVHEGQKVPEGMLLVAMDDTEAQSRAANALAALKGAQAAWLAAQHGGTAEERLSLDGELQKAIIDRDQAQKDLDALRKLQETGAASPSEVSAAQERLAADTSSVQVLQQRQTSRYDAADLAHAKANLDDAQAAYDAAEHALSQAVVHAPLAGTVYSLPIQRTEFVQQGELLFAIADLSKLEVTAYFDEPEIGDLAVGQSATIAWDAKPDEVWHGHVTRLPANVVTYGTSRNVGPVRISIDDPDGALLPDANVRVTITVSSQSNILTVPRDALHTEQGSNYVYRVAGGTLHRDPVQVGQLNLTDVQILRGLRAGDQVALTTTNGQPLIDGEPVKIVD